MKKIILLILTAILALAGMACWLFVIKAPELHARSCIQTITSVADSAIKTDIKDRNYEEAVSKAEYINGYYPIGTVLQSWHPFAVDYEKARQEQLRRIATALTNATSLNCGIDWPAWTLAIKALPAK